MVLVGTGSGEAGSTGKELVGEAGLVVVLGALVLLVGSTLVGVAYLKLAKFLSDSLAHTMGERCIARLTVEETHCE